MAHESQSTPTVGDLTTLRRNFYEYIRLMADESQSMPTFHDLMTLRKDSHEMHVRLVGRNENSPEVLRDIAEIDRLAYLLDGLLKTAFSPEQWECWLEVTTTWKELEDTYENPASIFYHAVRTNDPSTLPNEFADWLIASPTPERVRELRARLGDEGMGVIQRAVAEKLLGRTPTGEYDFREFADRLENLNEDFRNELFGQGYQKLRDIATTARVLNMNHDRPSSRHGVQKRVEIGIAFGALVAATLEAWKGRPWVAAITIAVPLLYFAGQYGLGKLMHSPRFVDWLMTPKRNK
ncbi:MAG: hypothetical protein ACLP7O_16400 [Terracidiphilus sp.]